MLHDALWAPWRLTYLQELKTKADAAGGGDAGWERTAGGNFLASYWADAAADQANHVVHRDAHGLILLNRKLLEMWTHEFKADGTLLGMTIPVPESLIQMTLFLAAITFMYVGARAVGAGEYRSHFLDPLIDDLQSTLLARNRYRGQALGV